MVAACCLASTRGLAQTPPAAGAEAWFQNGQLALQDNDLSSAEAAFRHVLVLDPKAGAAYSNFGVIAMRQKKWDEALQNLRKAEKLSPRTTGIRLNIGLVEFRRGNFREAISPFQMALREAPDAVQPRYLLGLCQVLVEVYPSATMTLEPLWDAMSSDVMYLYVFGMAANKSGKKDLDERAMKQMIDIGSNAPQFHLILAKAYLYAKDYRKAVDELQKGEATDPSLPFLHFNRGIAYMHMGENEKSEAEFKKDVAIEPDIPDSYERLGMLYLRQQRDAESSFHEALKRDARSANAYYGLTRILQRQGKIDSALKTIDEALKLSPDSYNVHLTRPDLAVEGKEEEAEQEFAVAKRLLGANLDHDREDLNKSIPSPELKQAPN
jgi:tetratricopeptide (TPR) repeat protein